MNRLFRLIAKKTSDFVGSPWSFVGALMIIVIWGITGPLFNFTDTWQLIINTGTTIVTFLMVFLIQNTQNRESKALHIKLDEIIRSSRGAKNALIDAEEMSDEELEVLMTNFHKISHEHAKRRQRKATSTIASVPGNPKIS